MMKQPIDTKELEIRQRVKNSMKSREERSMPFHDEIPSFIHSIDKNGCLLNVTECWLEKMGYKREEVIGHKSVEFLTEESRRYAESVTLPEFMKTGYARDIPYKFVTKSGEIIDVLLSAIAEWDEDGNYTRSLAILADITEQKSAEDEKSILQEQLAKSRRMESLGLLAGGVAHDLNNIIAPIMAYPDLIRMDYAEGKPIDRDLDAITASAQRASDVISDLMALTRRGQYEMVPIDLNDLVNDYLNSAECQLIRKLHPEVKPNIQLSKDRLLIKGSKAHLPNVIMNLINNACESMTEGGVLSITTSSINVEDRELNDKHIPKGRYNLLTIEDQGEGISEKNISKIFNPFFTTKIKTGKSGTGLGLSVVYNVLKDHGASIDVESKLGIGSKFSIYFPETTEKLERTEKDVELQKGSGNILVVDDRVEQRDIATRLLTTLGYEVMSVDNGQDAIKYLSKNDVDVVFLDMILEGKMDGLDTYKEIIKIKPDQKAIIVSGYSKSDRMKKAEELGVKGFIQKPYRMNEIGMALKKVLAK